jgi:hypothetical protein
MGYEMTPTDLLADRLGISEEAVALARSSPFVDLHIDSFIWTRFVGYDLNARHTRLITGGRYAGHLDFPRAIDAGLSGGLYTITTNPFRSARGRWATFNKNLARLSHTIDASGGKVRKVTTWSGYQAAVADGAHAAMIKIQGGNALSADAGYAHGFDDDSVLAITVVHLTHNTLGRTSTPLPGWSGPALTAAGHAASSWTSPTSTPTPSGTSSASMTEASRSSTPTPASTAPSPTGATSMTSSYEPSPTPAAWSA